MLFAHCFSGSIFSKFGILLNTELHSSLECILSDRKRIEIFSCFKMPLHTFFNALMNTSSLFIRNNESLLFSGTYDNSRQPGTSSKQHI